jgi:hypothetical protein
MQSPPAIVGWLRCYILIRGARSLPHERRIQRAVSPLSKSTYPLNPLVMPAGRIPTPRRTAVERGGDCSYAVDSTTATPHTARA